MEQATVSSTLLKLREMQINTTIIYHFHIIGLILNSRQSRRERMTHILTIGMGVGINTSTIHIKIKY